MAEEAKKKDGFFKGVQKEFGRITWPTRKEVAKQTLVVMVLSILLGLIISALDVGFSSLVNLLSSIG